MPATTRSLRWEGDPYFSATNGIRDPNSRYADQAANDLMRELQSKGYDPTTGGALLKNESDSFSVNEDRYSLIPDIYSQLESRYDHPDAQVAHPRALPQPHYNIDDDATRDPSYYLNSSSTSYSTQNDKTTFESSYEGDDTKGSYTDESGTEFTEDGEYSDIDNDTSGSRKSITTDISLEKPLRRAPQTTKGTTTQKVVNATAPKRKVPPPVPTGRRDQAPPSRPLLTQNRGTTTTKRSSKTLLQVPPSTSYMSSKSESTSSLSRLQELQRKKQKVKDLVKRFEKKDAFIPRYPTTDFAPNHKPPTADPPERQRIESRTVDKKSAFVPSRANVASAHQPKKVQPTSNNHGPTKIISPREEQRRKTFSLAIETQDDDKDEGIPPPPRFKVTTKALADMMESPHSTIEPLSPTLRTTNGRLAKLTLEETTTTKPSTTIDDSLSIHTQENMPPSPNGKKRGLWSRLVQPKSKSAPDESRSPMQPYQNHPTKDCQMVTREQLFKELEMEGLDMNMRQQPYRRWKSDAVGSLVGKMISPGSKEREIVSEPLTMANSDWSLVSRESECLSEDYDNADNNVVPSKGPFRNIQKGFMKRFQKAPHDNDLMDSDLDSDLVDNKLEHPPPAAQPIPATVAAIIPAPHRQPTQIHISPNKGLLPVDLEMIKAGKAGMGKKGSATEAPSDQASRGSSILPNIDRSDISSHGDSVTSDAISESGVEAVLEQTLSPSTRKTSLFLETNGRDSNLGAIYVRPSPKVSPPIKTTMAGIVKKVSTRIQSPKKAPAAGLISSNTGKDAAKEMRLLPPRHTKTTTSNAALANNALTHPTVKQALNAPAATPGRRMLRLLGPEKEQENGFPFMSNPSGDDHSNHVTTVARASSSVGSYEDQSIEIIDGSQQGITLTFSCDDGSTHQHTINHDNPVVSNPSAKVTPTSSSGSVIMKSTKLKLESMTKAEPVIVETVQSKSDSESTSSIGLNSNKDHPIARSSNISRTPNNTVSSKAENKSGKLSSTETPAEAARPTKTSNDAPQQSNGFARMPLTEKDGRFQASGTEISQNKDTSDGTSPLQIENDVEYEETLEVDLSWKVGDDRNTSIESHVDQKNETTLGTTSVSQKQKSESSFPLNNFFRRAFTVKKKEQPEAGRSLREKSEAKTQHPHAVDSSHDVSLVLEQQEEEPSCPMETTDSQQQPFQVDMTRSLTSSTSQPSVEHHNAVHDKKAVRFSEEPAMIHEIPAIQSGSVTIDSSTRASSTSPTPSEDTYSSTSSFDNSSTSSNPRDEPRKNKGVLSFVRRKSKRRDSKRAPSRALLDNSLDRSRFHGQVVPEAERRSTGSPEGLDGNPTEGEGIELIARRSKTGKNAVLISKSDGKSPKDSTRSSRSRSQSRSRSPYRRNMTSSKGKNSPLGSRLFAQLTKKPGKRSQAQALRRAQTTNPIPVANHPAGKTGLSELVYHPAFGPESKSDIVAEHGDPLNRREPTQTKSSTLVAESVATDEAEPGSSVGTNQSTDSSMRMDTSVVEEGGGDFLSWLLPGIFGPIPAKTPPPRRPVSVGMRAHADELSSHSSGSTTASRRVIDNEEWLEILSATEILAIQYQKAQTMDEESAKSISEETIRNVNAAIATFKEHARRLGVNEKQLMEAIRDDDRTLHSSKRSSVTTGKENVGGADRFLQMYEYYFSPEEPESIQPVSVN